MRERRRRAAGRSRARSRDFACATDSGAQPASSASSASTAGAQLRRAAPPGAPARSRARARRRCGGRAGSAPSRAPRRQPRQPLRAAGARHDAEPHLGEPDLGALDAERGSRTRARARARRRTPSRSSARSSACGSPPSASIAPAIALMYGAGLRRRHALALLEIGARAERLVAGAGDHDRAHVVASRRARARARCSSQVHRARQRVAHVGPVERDPRDAGRVSRRRSLDVMRRAIAPRCSARRRARACLPRCAFKYFDGSSWPTNVDARARRLDQLVEIDAGLDAHRVQHRDDVLGREVARRARRVRTAAEPAGRRVDRRDAHLHRDDAVRERGALRVVEVHRERARADASRARAPSTSSTCARVRDADRVAERDLVDAHVAQLGRSARRRARGSTSPSYGQPKHVDTYARTAHAGGARRRHDLLERRRASRRSSC